MSFSNKILKCKEFDVCVYHISNVSNDTVVNLKDKILINLFHVTGFFLYPLKTTQYQKFCDVFRGYGKRLVP